MPWSIEWEVLNVVRVLYTHNYLNFVRVLLGFCDGRMLNPTSSKCYFFCGVFFPISESHGGCLVFFCSCFYVVKCSIKLGEYSYRAEKLTGCLRLILFVTIFDLATPLFMRGACLSFLQFISIPH